MDPKRIDDFAAGGQKLRNAVAGLTRNELLWVPPPGAGIGLWSIQQILLHLMDDELIWSARMKGIIAEENPQILSFDEAKFAANLFPEAQDAEIAVQILDLNRRQLASILRKLSDSAFARTAQHQDLGVITLEQSFQWTAEHLDHHMRYIALKRDKLGKPLKG
ncbi:MAG: DinB family protein [Tepidisphaeraceae bacterium]